MQFMIIILYNPSYEAFYWTHHVSCDQDNIPKIKPKRHQYTV